MARTNSKIELRPRAWTGVLCSLPWHYRLGIGGCGIRRCWRSLPGGAGGVGAACQAASAVLVRPAGRWLADGPGRFELSVVEQVLGGATCVGKKRRLLPARSSGAG